MSSLACKCVFETPEQNARRDPMETNFEGLEMKNLPIPTYRAQRVKEKIRSFLSLSGLVSKKRLLKCQKRLIFLFSANDSKKSVLICTKYLNRSLFKRGLSEYAMDCWILSYH